MDITLTKYKIEAETKQMYDYAINVQDTLELFLPNIDEIMKMTELEFIDWFKDWLYKQVYGSDYKNQSITDDDSVKFFIKQFIVYNNLYTSLRIFQYQQLMVLKEKNQCLSLNRLHLHRWQLHHQLA